MLEDAISYPRQSEESTRTIAIGGLLTVFAFLVLPVLFMLGYVVRVLRTSVDGEAEPPAFDTWGDLLVDGLKAFVIGLVYSLVPLLLTVAATLAIAIPVGTFVVTTPGEVASSAGAAGLGAVSAVLVLFGLGLLLVAGVASLALAYVLPAALVAFASSGRMASAFAFGDLWQVLRTGTYGVGWLLALAVSVVASAAVGALAVVPVLGYVVGAFVSFYALVVAARLYGESYAKATPVPREPESGTGQPAA